MPAWRPDTAGGSDSLGSRPRSKVVGEVDHEAEQLPLKRDGGLQVGPGSQNGVPAAWPRQVERAARVAGASAT